MQLLPKNFVFNSIVTNLDISCRVSIVVNRQIGNSIGKLVRKLLGYKVCIATSPDSSCFLKRYHIVNWNWKTDIGKLKYPLVAVYIIFVYQNFKVR